MGASSTSIANEKVNSTLKVSLKMYSILVQMVGNPPLAIASAAVTRIQVTSCVLVSY